MSDKTEAEEYFDRTVKERRLKGRETYGKGLDHEDPYDWNRMALEEAMDLAQYLAAEVLRQKNRSKNMIETIATVVSWPKDRPINGELDFEMRRIRNDLADAVRQWNKTHD